MTVNSWPQIESYEQALQFVYGRIDYERLQVRDYSSDDLKLDRMRRLLEVLGNPQEKIPTFHVAGTKGKGSTCEMMASILQAAGKTVGLYTSPHISRFEERIRIAGIPLSRSEFVDQLKQLLASFESEDHREMLQEATFFELTTALAWRSFWSRQVDCVVLEVGLGGRLDCTNICKPIMTAITRIGLDHTQVLGNTLSQIASEKAGIMKPGVPVIVSSQESEAEQVISGTGSRIGARLFHLGKDVEFRRHFDKEAGQQAIDLTIQGKKIPNIFIPSLGIHQCENAATAISAVLLSSLAKDVTVEDVRNGLRQVRLPLRMEFASSEPDILLDAAHNPTAIQSLISTLNESRRDSKRVLVFGSSKDKDVPEMARLLANQFETIIVTEYQTNPRAVAAEDLQTIFETQESSGQLVCIPSPAAALRKAQELAQDDSLICVTGSFFLAAELRELLLPENQAL